MRSPVLRDRSGLGGPEQLDAIKGSDESHFGGRIVIVAQNPKLKFATLFGQKSGSNDAMFDQVAGQRQAVVSALGDSGCENEGPPGARGDEPSHSGGNSTSMPKEVTLSSTESGASPGIRKTWSEIDRQQLSYLAPTKTSG